MRWEIIVNFSLHLIIILQAVMLFNKFSFPLKLIALTSMVTCLAEIYAGFLMIKSQQNHFIYHVLVPIQYSLIAFAYSTIFEKPILVKITRWSIVGLTGISVFMAMKIQKLDQYNSIVCAFKHALMSLIVLSFLLETFITLRSIRLIRDPMFWISGGLLLSSLGNFFIEGLMNYMIQNADKEVAKNFYLAGATSTYLFYVTIIVAFSLIIRQQKTID